MYFYPLQRQIAVKEDSGEQSGTIGNNGEQTERIRREIYFMEKGTKFNSRQPTGEVKECKITRVKPSFFYFNIKNEYRFNTVLECLEKKVNDKWVECSEWENVIFAEDSVVENLSLNPFWTYHRRELAKIILFLTHKRSLSILYRIAYNLLDKSELQRYTAYTEGTTAG